MVNGFSHSPEDWGKLSNSKTWLNPNGDVDKSSQAHYL